MNNHKPQIIVELEDLVVQATTEHSHYYVRSVAEKAILAIGMLMSENERFRKALQEIDTKCCGDDSTAWSIASEALEKTMNYDITFCHPVKCDKKKLCQRWVKNLNPVNVTIISISDFSIDDNGKKVVECEYYLDINE